MDNLALALLAGEDILQISDLALDFRQLIDDLLAFQGSQFAQLHGQDGVGLDIVDVEKLLQALACLVHGGRTADKGNDLIKHV